MTGEKTMANLIAETRCSVLLIPITLFSSLIMSEPQAVQQISRIIAERYRMLQVDPAKAAAAFRKNEDPYGLQLKGERPEKVMVINCGSSSLKYSFYDTEDEAKKRSRRQSNASIPIGCGTPTRDRAGKSLRRSAKAGTTRRSRP